MLIICILMGISKSFHASMNQKKAYTNLYYYLAGDRIEHPDLQSLAMEVAKKCAGLPLAIVTVARALKNKNLSQWKNALRELKRPSPRNFAGVQEDVYAAIELSYNHLESKELKSTFLLCSRMGYNASTRDLLKLLNIKLNLDGQGRQPPAATDQPPATSCMPPSHHRPQPPSHLKVELSCFEFVYK